MTYDKETRAELMQNEAREDMQDKVNEFNDGSLDTYIDDNKDELEQAFIEDSDFKDFCKQEHNNSFETWLKEQKRDLKDKFIQYRDGQFNEFCKSQFNEINE